MTKSCSKCKANKPLADFTLRRSGQKAGQYSSECKRCKADYMNDYYRRKEAESPGYMRRKYDAATRSKYNLSQREIEALLESQGNACAICGSKEPRGLNGSWCIDHDHACCPGDKSCGLCVRGILCANCNTGVGLLGDDVDRLMSAAAYLMQRVNLLESKE